MSDAVTTFTDDNFASDVEGSDKLVLVDFWAEWCAPCRMLAPTVEELANDNGDAVSVGKLNVDDNAGTAAKYGIRGIPTILLFKGGEVKEQIVGVRPKNEIQALIDQHK